MVETYNKELEKLSAEGKGTWFTAPWLYAECYLYRLLRSYFTSTKYWKDYDPFRAQKEGTFQASGTAIYSMPHPIVVCWTDADGGVVQSLRLQCMNLRQRSQHSSRIRISSRSSSERWFRCVYGEPFLYAHVELLLTHTTRAGETQPYGSHPFIMMHNAEQRHSGSFALDAHVA